MQGPQMGHVGTCLRRGVLTDHLVGIPSFPMGQLRCMQHTQAWPEASRMIFPAVSHVEEAIAAPRAGGGCGELELCPHHPT